MAQRSRSKLAASRGRSEPVQVRVCSTRWKDPVTGQFVTAPLSADPAKVKEVKRPRKVYGPDDIVVRRFFKTDEYGRRLLSRVTVRWPHLREAVKRGDLTASEAAAIEADTAADILREEAPTYERLADSELMGAAHRSDKARRGAETRKRNAARSPKAKPRSPVAIRADLLDVDAKLSVVSKQLQGTKSDARREALRTRKANLSKKRGLLQAEAKKAGVSV